MEKSDEIQEVAAPADEKAKKEKSVKDDKWRERILNAEVRTAEFEIGKDVYYDPDDPIAFPPEEQPMGDNTADAQKANNTDDRNAHSEMSVSRDKQAQEKEAAARPFTGFTLRQKNILLCLIVCVLILVIIMMWITR